MTDSLMVLLLAFALDLLLGDPVYRFHPIRLIGKLIATLEALLERIRQITRVGGLLLLLSVQGIVLGLYALIYRLPTAPALALTVFTVYSCISIQDLRKHGKAVWRGLTSEALQKARDSVQMLIGRDANTLDPHGVARAAVESLAENFVDGFLAPVFWFVAGCLVAEQLAVIPLWGGGSAILFYKVTNTLDSMVGYKSDRYEQFGKVSAKLDDLLNFLPARLGIPIIAFSALLCRLDGLQAWRIGWRDRLKHSSPNAGHSEASIAGALHIRLNGPGIYPHGRVDKPWVGDGTPAVTAAHLQQTATLILCAAVVTTTLFALLLAAV